MVQLVGHLTVNEDGEGSNPSAPAKLTDFTATYFSFFYVQPPVGILNDILAIRLHLDESEPDNGPLRVIPGSHKQGRISAEKVAEWQREKSGSAQFLAVVRCSCDRGCFTRLLHVSHPGREGLSNLLRMNCQRGWSGTTGSNL